MTSEQVEDFVMSSRIKARTEASRIIHDHLQIRTSKIKQTSTQNPISNVSNERLGTLPEFVCQEFPTTFVRRPASLHCLLGGVEATWTQKICMIGS